MVITLDNVLRGTALIYTGLDGWQSLYRRPPLHVGIYMPLRMSCRSDDLRNGSVGSDYDPPGFSSQDHVGCRPDQLSLYHEVT